LPLGSYKTKFRIRIRIVLRAVYDFASKRKPEPDPRQYLERRIRMRIKGKAVSNLEVHNGATETPLEPWRVCQHPHQRKKSDPDPYRREKPDPRQNNTVPEPLLERANRLSLY
jgi:hypothetical protein